MKSSSTFKLFVSSLSTNCLSVFDHIVGFALKGLMLTKNSYHLNDKILILNKSSYEMSCLLENYENSFS